MKHVELVIEDVVNGCMCRSSGLHTMKQSWHQVALTEDCMSGTSGNHL